MRLAGIRPHGGKRRAARGVAPRRRRRGNANHRPGTPNRAIGTGTATRSQRPNGTAEPAGSQRAAYGQRGSSHRPDARARAGPSPARHQGLGITAATKPFRAWANAKRRFKRRIGYESEAGRLIRDGPPRPTGRLVVVAVLGAAATVATILGRSFRAAPPGPPPEQTAGVSAPGGQTGTPARYNRRIAAPWSA